jgi:hypothetical protein
MNDREPAIKRRYCRRRISFMTSIYDRRITWQQLYSSMDRHFVLSNCRGAIAAVGYGNLYVRRFTSARVVHKSAVDNPL